MQTKQTTRRRITVPVDRVRLAMIVPAEEEVSYRWAAEELGHTVHIYRNRYPNNSEIPGAGYVAMAAVDIAYRAYKLSQRLETRGWCERLQVLNDEAERLLDLLERPSVVPAEAIP